MYLYSGKNSASEKKGSSKTNKPLMETSVSSLESKKDGSTGYAPKRKEGFRATYNAICWGVFERRARLLPSPLPQLVAQKREWDVKKPCSAGCRDDGWVALPFTDGRGSSCRHPRYNNNPLILTVVGVSKYTLRFWIQQSLFQILQTREIYQVYKR